MCSAKLSYSTVYSVDFQNAELQSSQEEIHERELNSMESRVETCCKRTIISREQHSQEFVELRNMFIEQSRQVVELKNVVLGQSEQLTEQSHKIEELQKTVFVLNKSRVNRRDLKLLKIEKIVFIEENQSIHKFFTVIYSHLSSAFSSTFVLAQGDVARSQKEWRDRTVQGFGIAGEIATVIPQVRAFPGAGHIISTATRVLTTLMQAYLDQRNVNHAKSRIEIMLTPGKMEKQSEKVAMKLCEMYEWQLSKLTVEGSERLAIHAITEILSFMLYGNPKSTSVQSFHRQWIQVLQERKRTYWDEFKNSITHLGHSSCLEFFQIYRDELSTVDDIKKAWIGLEPFSKCGVRLKGGAYFVGEATKHERYGYRIGRQEEIRNMQQEEVLKELSYIPTFPQLEDIQAETFVPRRPLLEPHQEQESLVAYQPSRVQSSWRASTHTVKRDFSSDRTYLVFKMAIDSRDQTVVSYISREGCLALGSRVTIIVDMEAESLFREKMSIENRGDLMITDASKVQRIFDLVRLEAYYPLAYPIAYNTFGRDSALALDEKMFRIVTPKLQNAYKEDPALLKEIFLCAEKYRKKFNYNKFSNFTHSVHDGTVAVLDRKIKENEDEIFSHRLIAFNPISLAFSPVLGPLLLHWESIRKEEYKDLMIYLKVISMAQKGLNAFGRILGVRNWGERQGFKTDFFYDMEKYTLSDRLLAARDQVVLRFFRTFLQGMSYKTIRPHNSYTWAIDKLKTA